MFTKKEMAAIIILVVFGLANVIGNMGAPQNIYSLLGVLFGVFVWPVLLVLVSRLFVR
ncbi:MAG: hypothetical protein ABEI52_03530 [Halobacteriaceae archaeon]